MSSPSSLERKLIVLLIGCKDLPGHRATGVNDAYVSLRVMEHFQKVKDDTSGAAASLSSVGSGSFSSKNLVIDSSAVMDLGSGGGNAFGDFRFEKEELGDTGPIAVGRHAISPTATATLRRQSTTVIKRQHSLRRGSSLRRDSAQAVDPSLLEPVTQMLDGQKYQSHMVQSTSNPEYGQVFVFDHLQIPLKRRSSSVLLNNTLTGGSDPTVARQAATDRKKINCKYSLAVEVMDNTTSKGLGERFCFGDVQLDELVQGKRTTLWVPLIIDETVDNVIRPNKAALESLDGLVETQEELEARMEKYRKHPKIGLVLEPVNFGVLPESIRGESTELAIWRALNEELGSVFSIEFLRKLQAFLVAADEQGIDAFDRDDVVEMLLELYFFTGTSAPPDVDLVEEVQYLMALFDRGPEDGVNVSELCGILKMSKLALQLRPKWLVGKKLSVVTASSIAGALWEPKAIPVPFQYSGFRKTNGAVYEKTKRPPACKLPLYAVKPYVNLYNELYADEEARVAKLELQRLAQEEEEEFERQRAEEDQRKGIYRDDTAPMFVPKSDKNRRYTAEREERSLAQLFAPPNVRTALDEDLVSTFHDAIESKTVEYTKLEFCEVKHSTLVGCRIRGGKYLHCSFESCVLEQGAELVEPGFVRCCSITQCRVTLGHPVNCHMAYATLRECPLIAQCSLFSCDVGVKSVLVQSYVRECMIDPTVVDDGANKMEHCRFLEKPRQSLIDQLLEEPS